MAFDTGKTLMIVNPAAQIGRGAEAARLARERFLAARPDFELDIVETERMGHAIDIAANALSYDTVIALGGDGVIHEVANGLMRIAPLARPAFGVIPVGSGNDFARTVGISTDPTRAVDLLLDSEIERFDVGQCNDQYFVETLSFGLDAAIALETQTRRVRSGETGTILYAKCGVNQFLHHFNFFDFHIVLENGVRLVPEETGAFNLGESVVEARGEGLLLLAVQVGKTYGGGFKICPEADSSDGLFDICAAHGPAMRPRCLATFLMAKDGKHVTSKLVDFYRASALTVRVDDGASLSGADVPMVGEDFNYDPEGDRIAVQMDGEGYWAPEYRIKMIPGALEVLVPRNPVKG